MIMKELSDVIMLYFKFKVISLEKVREILLKLFKLYHTTLIIGIRN
jgi:hypothetical protein